MNNNDYLTPGIVAIATAILAPTFWLYAALSDYSDGTGLGLVFADWVFLVLGAMAIYVYFSLKDILHNHHNFHKIDALLMMTIATIVIFYLGSLALEIFAPMIDSNPSSRHETILGLKSLFGAICAVIFGVLDILIANVLWRNKQQLPELLKVFAIVTLIQGIFEVTILFSFFGIFIYAIAMLILAMYFLRKPEMIEVV